MRNSIFIFVMLLIFILLNINTFSTYNLNNAIGWGEDVTNFMNLPKWVSALLFFNFILMVFQWRKRIQKIEVVPLLILLLTSSLIVIPLFWKSWILFGMAPLAVLTLIYLYQILKTFIENRKKV